MQCDQSKLKDVSLKTPIWCLQIGGFPRNAIVSVDTAIFQRNKRAMRNLALSRSIKTGGIVGSVNGCACASFVTRDNWNQINRLCWFWKSHHIIVCWSVPATEFYVEVVHFMFAIACIVCQLWNYVDCPCNCSSWCNVRAESVTARLCCNLVQDHQHLTLGSFQYLCWVFESFRMEWDAGRLSNDESKKMVQSSAAFSWFVIFF